MKKTIFSISFIVIVLVVLFYFFYIAPKNNNQIKQEKSACLSDDRVARYEIDKKRGITSIFIENKRSSKEVFDFQIDSILSVYHPIELHKCGVYVLRGFNFDSKKMVPLKGFSRGLWKYSYDFSYSELLNFANEGVKGAPVVYYSYDFRVDPTEKYVVLEKGYSGKNDYAVMIKNLETKEDVFTLPMKEIADLNNELVGNFGMNEWTKDGKYYWGNIFDGANVLAFFRVESETWKMEFFPAPEGTMGGDVLNPENGYVTFDDGAPWTGDEDFNQMYRDQWKKEEKKVSFYLYNLFTKEKILLETFDDPTWFSKPKWVSDTELQYELPTGEKKIYNGTK